MDFFSYYPLNETGFYLVHLVSLQWKIQGCKTKQGMYCTQFPIYSTWNSSWKHVKAFFKWKQTKFTTICTLIELILTLVNGFNSLEAWTLKNHSYFYLMWHMPSAKRFRIAWEQPCDQFCLAGVGAFTNDLYPGHLAAGMGWPWTLRANPESRSCTSARNKKLCHKTTSTAALDWAQQASAHSALLLQTGWWTGNRGLSYEESE